MVRYSKFRMEGEILYPNVLILGQSPKAQKEIYGMSCGEYGLINERKGYWHFYDKEKIRQFGLRILEKFFKDEEYYKAYSEKCRKFSEEFEEMDSFYYGLDYKSLSKDELITHFHRICRYGVEQFNYMYPPSEAIGLAALQFVKEQMKKEGSNIPIDILFEQEWKSYIVKEEESIFEIAARINESKKLKELFEDQVPSLSAIEKADRELAAMISQHTRKYWFAFSSYLSINHANEEFFIRRIKEHLKARNTAKEVFDKKAKLKEMGASQDLMRLIGIIDAQSEIFDYRKTLNLRLLYFLMRLLEEIGKKIGADAKDLIMLLPGELEDAFSGKLSPDEIKEKVEKNFSSVQVFDEEGIRTLYGRDAEEKKKILLGQKTDFPLKGIPASPGRMKGKVRVIRAFSDNSEFNKGDILVTTHTTPDWLPLMKKAGAIITERGGVTSHSAIVSRELKMPCIVSVDNAVNMLKDGDEIEIDADKGLIDKL